MKLRVCVCVCVCMKCALNWGKQVLALGKSNVFLRLGDRMTEQGLSKNESHRPSQKVEFSLQTVRSQGIFFFH